jgi:DGQHR domain-containing protein
MKLRKVETRNIPALEVRHHQTLRFWVFAADPKEIRAQSNVDRMRWDEATKAFLGYQRDITEAQVQAILEYLNSGDAILPNAIVLAVRESVGGTRVEFHSGQPDTDRVRSGTLTLPFNYEVTDGTKTGVQDSPDSLAWVVDGQHRMEALTKLAYNPGTFPVLFSAICTSDVKVQAEQYARLNLTLPIPKQNMDRLLAIVGAKIAERKALRQLAAKVRETMLQQPEAPFVDLVRRKRDS